MIPNKTYGPFTWNCSPYGWFTKLILYFVPTIIHETPDGIVVYKLFRNQMFVIGAIRKGVRPQHDKPLES